MSPVCRACLTGSAGDVKLHRIEDRLLEMYEKLTSTKLGSGNGNGNTLCYICYLQLQKCCRFSDMARKSEECLRELLKTNTQVTIKRASLNVVRTPSLSVMSLKPLYLDGKGKTKIKKKQLTAIVDTTKDVYNERDAIIEGYVKKETIKKEKMTAQELISKLESEEIADEELYDIELGLLSKDDTEYTVINSTDLFYECDLCKDIFPTHEELTAHQCTHKKENILYNETYCPICKKILIGQTAQLQEHMKIHTGDRPYICDHCGKSSRTKQHLREHLKVHTKEKVYCEICEKGFSQVSSLGKHVLIHTGEEPYSCHVCGKTFKQSGHMRSHIRFVHEGVRPHCCKLCGKRFSGKSHWQRHMETHSGTKAYSCDYCHTKFVTLKSKTRHIKLSCKKKPAS